VPDLCVLPIAGFKTGDSFPCRATKQILEFITVEEAKAIREQRSIKPQKELMVGAGAAAPRRNSPQWRQRAFLPAAMAIESDYGARSFREGYSELRL